jgi:hypothetical protein
MNYNEIEALKNILANLSRKGCRLRIPSYGIDGRLVGIGFKPYWTTPTDTKIEKIEFNVIDSFGRTAPFILSYITGYDVISGNDSEPDGPKVMDFDFHVYSPGNSRFKQPNEKVRVEMEYNNPAPL